MVYTSEKLFEEMKGKISDAKIDDAKKEVEALKELLKPEKKDFEEIKKKLEEATKKVQEMSIEMYQKAAEEQAKKKGGSPGNGAGGAEGKGKGDEKVVDADYTEGESGDGSSEAGESQKKTGKK